MSLYSDHTYRTLIFGGSGSGKTNVLLNLLKITTRQHYLYVKNPLQSKYELLNNERKKLGIKKVQNLSLVIHKQLMLFMKF